MIPSVLTKGLQNLWRQIDANFPNRRHESDGAEGDKEHRARTSGHNPDDTKGSKPAWDGDSDHTPEARAADIDSDLEPGDPGAAQRLVDWLIKLPGLHLVLRYIIFDRRIYHVDNGFKPVAYHGDDPHTGHLHFEGAWSQAADNNTTFNFQLEGVPMALTAADRKWIVSLFNEAAQSDKTPTSYVGRNAFDQGIPDGTIAGTPRRRAWEVVRNLGQVITKGFTDMSTRLSAIESKLPQ